MIIRNFLFILLISSLTLTAQTTNENDDQNNSSENVSDEANRTRRWQASLPSGQYSVKLDSITSLSQHEYLLDGTLIVTEVTIDTTGNSLARFYYIEPVVESASGPAQRLTKAARELAERAARRSGATITDMAQKSYPTTTHARTVEYRLKTKGSLLALYQSVAKAWDSGKGRNLSIEE